MRKHKIVVMSRKEITLIILTIIGAVALYAWQTFRMSQHMLAAPVKQSVPVASGTAQSK